jgi:putative hydrolase of the HAD superfamily
MCAHFRFKLPGVFACKAWVKLSDRMNLIFDLGGVVVEWNPQAICAQAFDDPALRQVALKHILQHPDWLALDRGSLARGDAIRRAASRTAWSPSAVDRFFDAVLASLRLKEDTVALMQRFHAAGHSLYCLSNMPHHALAYLEQTYTFWELFKARVISCQVGMCKPEPDIYAHLLQHCGIEAANSVFIDDMQVNVDAAAAFGIHPLRFDNAAQCDSALNAWLNPVASLPHA